MKAINRFLLANGLDLKSNPCVSPDFCLDANRLRDSLIEGKARSFPKATLALPFGTLALWEDVHGDHAWVIHPAAGAKVELILAEGFVLPGGSWAFPATFENLLRLKNVVLKHDPASTIFPSAGGTLGKGTLGVGARFTTLHWPAVEWAMASLGLGLTANQNSIPRELVYDVDAMLDGSLDSVPFPFLGANVPEGHQGQSVEGMSHGSILSKLKTGFHLRRIPWSFNADHQPIGGKFDAREDALVRGCLLASYITFDLSPELAITKVPADAKSRASWVAREVDPKLLATVRARVAAAGVSLDEDAFNSLVCYVWPGLRKMKVRDQKYQAIRAKTFEAEAGRTYLRELSIDELPGLTTPETTAAMLAFCEALDMPVNFVAPAFGFLKNLPYPDNAELRKLIERQWAVCAKFDVSIGIHSGSGKSEENYRIIGQVTGSRLEIKTSGRYTYEMGRALAASSNPSDQALWLDWYQFTIELASNSAFSADETERKTARGYIERTLGDLARGTDVFASPESCRAALAKLKASPEHMVFFEYNFLFVLASNGKASKAALGDHGPGGYRQRARFYSISEEARLRYARNVAAYLIFLAEATGLAPADRCARSRKALEGYRSYQDMLESIAP